MYVNKIWIFVFSIIGIILQAVVLILAILGVIGFWGIELILAIIGMLLAVTLIVFFSIIISKVKKNTWSKPIGMVCVILGSVHIAMSVFGIVLGFWISLWLFGIYIINFFAALVGFAIGLGFLATVKDLGLPPKRPKIIPQQTYGYVSPVGQYQNPYQYPQQNPYYQYNHPPQPTINQVGEQLSYEELKKELVALKSLLDDKLITVEEYDKRKSVLLEQS